jgi:seryl-tRNA synthetase
MLDLKRIRENTEEIKKLMDNRGEGINLSDFDEIVALDEKRREMLGAVESAKAKRNQVSSEIPKMKKAGEDVTPIMAEMKSLGETIKEYDHMVKETEEKIEYIMLRLPNIPHESVPDGDTDEDNVEVKTWGDVKDFAFEPKAHWDLGTDLDILDFERAGKVTGSRFTFLKGYGSRLERAIINYFLDTHTDHGYSEIMPPFMVNRLSMTGTGQLPKFEDDAFKLSEDDYFLIPTAEVPVTNMYRNETFQPD